MSARNSEVETNGWTTFDVPNQFEDLQRQLATGSYYVPSVLDLAEINTGLQSTIHCSKMRRASSAFVSDISRIRDPRELLDMFPLFYSIATYVVLSLRSSLFEFPLPTRYFDKVAFTGRSQAVEILLRCKHFLLLKEYR